jgi:hypothetical protein
VVSSIGPCVAKLVNVNAAANKPTEWLSQKRCKKNISMRAQTNALFAAHEYAP